MFVNRKKLVGLGVILALTVPLLTACPFGEPERSTEAFCEVYNEEKQEYLAKYGGKPEDGPSALVNALGAMSAWTPMIGRMKEHAPDEIAADMENIHAGLVQTFGEAGDSVQDPIGGMANAFMISLMTAESWQRFEEFVMANCLTDEEKANIAEAAAKAEADAKAAEEEQRKKEEEEARQAELDDALSDADYIVDIIRSELDYELDAQYLSDNAAGYKWYIDEGNQLIEDAKAALRDPLYADDPYYCDYPEDSPWGYAVTRTKELAADLEQVAADFRDSYWDTASVTSLVSDAKSAISTLERLFPDSPKIGTLEALIDDAEARKVEMDKLNEEGQAKVDDIAGQVAALVPQAEKVAASAC